jgi:hypothetical protein
MGQHGDLPPGCVHPECFEGIVPPANSFFRTSWTCSLLAAAFAMPPDHPVAVPVQKVGDDA